LAQIKELEKELKEHKLILDEKRKKAKETSGVQKEKLREIEQLEKLKEELEAFKDTKEQEWKNEKKQLQNQLSSLQDNFITLQNAVEGENDDLERKMNEQAQERDALLEQKSRLQEKLNSLYAKKEKGENELAEAAKKRLDMEIQVSDSQVLAGGLISTLAQDVAQHVEDMNVWKVFLKQKTSYLSETVQLDTRSEFEDLGYDESFNEFEKKLEAENNALMALLEEQILILNETKKTASNFNREKKARNVRAGNELKVGGEKEKGDPKKKGGKSSRQPAKDDKSDAKTTKKKRKKSN